MAIIYPAPDGTIYRALLSDDEEARYPDPPPSEEAGPPLRFDHDANAVLVADLRRSTDPYRLSADGVLTKDGEVVLIHPPAADVTAADVQAVLGTVTDPAAQAALARILARVLGQGT